METISMTSLDYKTLKSEEIMGNWVFQIFINYMYTRQ